MSNEYEYEFLRLLRVVSFSGFDPVPSDLNLVEEWIESQRGRLEEYADDIVLNFTDCHRAAAAELGINYPFEYALNVRFLKKGISYVWHRGIFYGGRKSPKRIEYYKLIRNSFGNIPGWERSTYDCVINNFELLYKHQSRLQKLTKHYRALRVSLEKI